MKNTLLQIARAHKHGVNASYPVNGELIELTVAWLKDDISLTAASKAISKKHGLTIYSAFARAMKQMYKDGTLKITA